MLKAGTLSPPSGQITVLVLRIGADTKALCAKL
jgi:hypothetical protein